MSSILNPAEVIALSKVVTAAQTQAASSELAVGTHEVDFLVQVTGSLKKGEDYTSKIVAKAEPWTLLAVALSHLNGVTVQSIVKEALDADPDLVKSIKKQATDAMAAVKGPTETLCNGKITTDLACSGIDG